MGTEFLNGGSVLLETEAVFPLGTDTVLLGDFAPAQGRICDLGGGSGGLSLLLLAKEPRCQVTLVELREKACAAAEKNRRINGLEDRLTVIRGDLRQIRTLLPQGSFSGVVSNPPYYPVGSGRLPRDEETAIARSELCCTPEDLCAAAAWLLPTGGTFCLCHKPERLTDLLCTLRAKDLEPKELRPVQDRAGLSPSLVLIKAVRGGKPGLRWLPALVLRDEEGKPSAEYRKIYHMEDEP